MDAHKFYPLGLSYICPITTEYSNQLFFFLLEFFPIFLYYSFTFTIIASPKIINPTIAIIPQINVKAVPDVIYFGFNYFFESIYFLQGKTAGKIAQSSSKIN
jgi:hypothetical protein